MVTPYNGTTSLGICPVGGSDSLMSYAALSQFQVCYDCDNTLVPQFFFNNVSGRSDSREEVQESSTFSFKDRIVSLFQYLEKQGSRIASTCNDIFFHTILRIPTTQVAPVVEKGSDHYETEQNHEIGAQKKEGASIAEKKCEQRSEEAPMDHMSLTIGTDGIASIDFTVGLDRCSILVRMTQPYEDTREFYYERNSIGNFFGAHLFSGNSVEIDLGSFSKKTISELKKPIDSLYEVSIINLERHDEIIKKLKEMVAPVELENDRETQQYAPFLVDFKTNVESLYDLYSLRTKNLIFDDSIARIGNLISEVCRYNGNFMKVGSGWVYLLLAEGALEHLIKSLNPQEHEDLRDRFVLLRLGVTHFLQQHESELHEVIEKTISHDGSWFQQLYGDYKSMVKSGKSPSEDCYGPITNMNLVTQQLFLPSRFAK